MQNPVADLISVPFQNNVDFAVGPNREVQNTLNIQPVVPIPLSERWLLLSRTIIPLVSQVNAVEGGHASGLGEISPTLFIAPTGGDVIFGVGPTFLLPTTTGDVRGTDKWSAGPAAVLAIQPKPWTIGALASNVWSFAGKSDRPAVSLFTLQYFVSYNLPGGWYLTSAPILSAQWKAEAGQKWIVPFGGGVGKIFKLVLPFNGQVSAYYNAIHPDNGPSWQLRLQLALLLPT